jgi:predicted RNA binding protein YcfA (HicA-like mRNA interferase family)
MADETKQLLDEARKQGWVVERTRNGHWRLRAPDGVTTVIVAGTSGDQNSIQHAVARMRRVGFVWKGR